MSAQRAEIRPNALVREIITDGTVEALNTALAQQGVDASAVIAVLSLPGTRLAHGQGERFRVLLRG